MIDLAPSSYYYQPAPPGRKAISDADIQDRLEALALEFPRYGYRRMTAQLHQEGCRVNHKRVLRLMRRSDLLCRVKRAHVHTTDSAHGLPVYPNLYQNRVPDELDRAWVADLTYIRLATTFVYLAVLLDACSRRVVGWALSGRLDASLSCAALTAAIRARQPPPGCIHHSDRGAQYAAHEYVAILQEHGFQISMSRAGNPYDNAQAESFLKTLKAEEVHLNDYPTFQEATRPIERFIEEVYNQKRLHSSLGYASPVTFERAHTHAQVELAPSP